MRHVHQETDDVDLSSSGYAEMAPSPNINREPKKSPEELTALILDCLRDPKWDFRTARGIAAELKEKGLSIDEDEVERLLLSNTEVRQSSVPDRSGRALFTLREKPVSSAERNAAVHMFLSKRAS